MSSLTPVGGSLSSVPGFSMALIPCTGVDALALQLCCTRASAAFRYLGYCQERRVSSAPGGLPCNCPRMGANVSSLQILDEGYIRIPHESYNSCESCESCESYKSCESCDVSNSIITLALDLPPSHENYESLRYPAKVGRGNLEPMLHTSSSSDSCPLHLIRLG